MSTELWDDDEVQFARLLCEIAATHLDLDVEALATSMDLQPLDIDELLERAHVRWERAKRDRLVVGDSGTGAPR